MSAQHPIAEAVAITNNPTNIKARFVLGIHVQTGTGTIHMGQSTTSASRLAGPFAAGDTFMFDYPVNCDAGGGYCTIAGITVGQAFVSR